MLFSDLIVQGYRIIYKFDFWNIFGKLPQNCLYSYNPSLAPCGSYRF